MKIDLSTKIHNRYYIEVKDINTGEITQKGYAENIILNSLFAAGSHFYTNVVSSTSNWNSFIQFGSGTGSLSPSRTTLFTRIDGIASTVVETVINEPPTVSYKTLKIVLTPESYVGSTITEVGLAQSSAANLYTHALIKDSEGNPLVLGPKKDTEEITIFATVFISIALPTGVTLPSGGRTAFIDRLLGNADTGLALFDTTTTNFRLRTSVPIVNTKGFSYESGTTIKTEVIIVGTSVGNGKIKYLSFGSNSVSYIQVSIPMEWFIGWEFDNTSVGVGTGSQTIFNLTWDEARLDKAKKVYVDGIEVTTGITWATGAITFDTAPANQAVITADYWVDYIPKDINHILDVQFIITFGEGTPV